MAAAIGSHKKLQHNHHHHHHHRGPVSNVNRFYHLNEINRGSYGVVHRAVDSKSGEIVAIKEEFFGMSASTAREVSILQSLPPHPSIVELRDVVVDRRNRVFVVMEYVESDLNRLMMETKRRPFTANGVKTAMRQILEGVGFLHEHDIMHRDIKPSNILFGNKGELKLCDFGLSRHTWSESGAYTPGVVTQWYRAPELLVGESAYSPAIDMWSVGCVMAELVLGQVLFPGRSEIQQLRYIFRVMGTPGLLRARIIAAVVYGGAPSLTASGIDLLERLLGVDPNWRITAREALNHAWFTESC